MSRVRARASRRRGCRRRAGGAAAARRRGARREGAASRPDAERHRGERRESGPPRHGRGFARVRQWSRRALAARRAWRYAHSTVLPEPDPSTGGDRALSLIVWLVAFAVLFGAFVYAAGPV